MKKSISFIVTLNDGTVLSGDTLLFNNLVDIYQVNRKFLDKIFKTYNDIYTIQFDVFCSSCLSLI